MGPELRSAVPEIKNYANEVSNLSDLSKDGKLEELEIKLKGFSNEELDKIKELVLKREETITDTKDQLLELTQKIELQNLNGYETLRETAEENKVLGELMKVFDLYIEEKLEINLNIKEELKIEEKDTLKLVLWGELLKAFSLNGGVGVLLKGAVESVKKVISAVDNKENQVESVTKMYKSIKSLLEDFGKDVNAKKDVFAYFDGIIGADSFNNISNIRNQDTENEIDFTNPQILKDIKNGKTDINELKGISGNNKKEYLESVKKETLEIGKKLEKGSEIGNGLIEMVNKILPKEMQKGLIDWVKEISNSYPIIGFLLGLIFGKEFINDKNGKKKENINNLLLFSKKENSVLKGLDENYLKELNPDNLNEFYSFLENDMGIKENEYVKEGFWETIFTGKPEDPKLLEIFGLLKGDKDEFELTDKEKKGEGFIDRLNGLSIIKYNNDKIKLKNQKTGIVASLTPVSVVAQEVKTGEDIEDEVKTDEDIEDEVKTDEVVEDEVKTEEVVEDETKIKEDERAKLVVQYTEYRDLEIRSAILESDKLPITINYEKGEELKFLGIEMPLSIDFKDGNILIGDTPYIIDFKTFKYEWGFINMEIADLKIKEITSIDTGNININVFTDKYKSEKDSIIPKDKFSSLVLGLLKSGKYADTILANGELPDINFEILKA